MNLWPPDLEDRTLLELLIQTTNSFANPFTNSFVNPFTNRSTMSILNLPSDMINHILSFLSVKDHNRFSQTCKAYRAFGVVKIECNEGAGGEYDDFANRYTVFRGHGNDDGVLRRVVELDVKKYTGTTKHVKELVIRRSYEYICGDTIQYIPKSLTGEGLRYLMRLDVDSVDKCTISNVRFERLITLRAYYCSIIGCKFDVLENLDLLGSQFLSEIPDTIKTLGANCGQFSDDCVKGSLVNLLEIYGGDYDFIQYAPNVKKAAFCSGELHRLPESLEYLRLCNVRVHGEEFRLPNLKYLEMERSTVGGHIIAPGLSELIIYNTRILALDCPALDVCSTYGMKCNIDINSVVLMTDRAVDPKKFPKMRALYFYKNPCEYHGDLGDMIYELDMIYIPYVTAKISANINTRVLVTLEIDKDVDLRKMSRLELLIAPAEYAAIVSAPIKFMEFNHAQHWGSGFIDLFKELFPDPPQ